MPPQRDPISVRTTRLNNLILGKGVGAVQKSASNASRRSIVPINITSAAVAEAICREGLLDAFCLLYNECDKETLKKRDRNIAEFVTKCEFPFNIKGGLIPLLYLCIFLQFVLLLRRLASCE